MTDTTVAALIDMQAIIKSLLPSFITAGDYALQVQHRVEGTTKAEEGTVFSQAITDADLSVQSFFEMTLLAKLPLAKFYGEESSHLLNSKYFPVESDYTVTLDPINHTLAYKDGLTAFDIILSISYKDEIQAAVVYLPAYGEFYIGIKDKGGFVTTRQAVEKDADWQPRELTHSLGKVLVYNNAELKERVSEKFECVDLAGDYDPHDWNLTISDILRGNLIGYIRPNAHIIDWGVIGFVVEQYGGVVSDVAGASIPNYWDFPSKKIPSLIVSVNQEVHLKLLQLIGSGGGL